MGGAETTTGAAQTVLLGLGGLLLGGGAVVLAVFALATTGTTGRVLLLTLLTPLALGLPVLLARRSLVATAETVAAVGLLLVLLDGYVAWSLNLFGADSVAAAQYAGGVCLATAAIAIAYRGFSHLMAPRFATALALQPVVPLLTYPWIHGPAGWGLALALVAALDVALAVTTPTAQSRVTRWLRELTWSLAAAGYLLALAFSVYAISTTGTLGASLRAAAVALLTGALGVLGGYRWGRRPLPAVAGALAAVVLILAIARVGAVALPGRTLLFAAIAVAFTAAVVALLPKPERLGPGIASGAAAAAVALMMLSRALPAIGAPLHAALPLWHANLTRYPDLLAAAAGESSWQVVVVGILLTVASALAVPKPVRADAVIASSALTVLAAPAALHLGPALTPAFTVTAAIGYGALALTLRATHRAYGCLLAAAVVGGYAAAASLSRPGVTALVLAALTGAGVIIAVAPRPARSDPHEEAVARNVAETAAGGAAFALPGAFATGVYALITADTLPGAGVTAVLAASFIGVCATLGYTAIDQVARRQINVALLVGTSAGAGAVAVAALFAPGATVLDRAVGLLLFASAVVLWYAPTLTDREVLGLDLHGEDVAAAAVTGSVLGALARVAELMVPDAGLVAAAGLVLGTAVLLRWAPANWRTGPIVGTAAAGLAVAVAAGAAAIQAALRVVRAATPAWHTQLGTWGEHLGHAGFRWQAPVALLLIAVAAIAVVPRPYSDEAAAIGLGLATVAAPVALGLPWWSPLVLGLVAVAVLGLAATAGGPARTAYVRLTVAGALALYMAGASAVSAAATAATLESLALAGTAVAAVAGLRLGSAGGRGDGLPGGPGVRDGRTASGTSEPPLGLDHLVPVGGAAGAAAVLAITGAAGAFAYALHDPPSVIRAGALAATSLSLAIAGLLCWRLPGFLWFVTAAVSLSATLVAFASLGTGSRAVYAAAAALLGVVAALLRTSAQGRTAGRHESTWQPPGGRSLRLAGTDLGLGVLAASVVPAAIAVGDLARPVLAAVLAPQYWLRHPWTGTPGTAAHLGEYAGWVGDSSRVLAAAALTLAGALAAVGLGGRVGTMASRAVAVAVPGAALTILIAPGALHWPGPLYSLTALVVTTMCGLALAWTPPADVNARTLRGARQVVFVLAALASSAGMAGSLATRSMTIQTLAGSVFVGLGGALWGRYLLARLIGWNVAAGALILLALACALAAGAALRWAAFPVLGASAVVLAFTMVLPRIRRRATLGFELKVIESSGYLGAAGALAMTWGSLRYTAAVCTALGAVLGLAAIRPGLSESYRRILVILAGLSEVVAVWLLVSLGHVRAVEAYTLPFAALALLVGLLELRRRPHLGSWLGYGPALIAGFLPTLVIVLSTDASATRRLALIGAAALTVAVGALRRQKAPVAVGTAVAAVATLHEMFLLGRALPWWLLLVVFTPAGVLLVGLGATYERRRMEFHRLRGAFGRMR